MIWLYSNSFNPSVTDSKIGVASKDSSITTIDQISMNQMEVCLSAYKKKKEEEGGILNIENEASSTKNTVIFEVQYLVLFTVYQQLTQ